MGRFIGILGKLLALAGGLAFAAILLNIVMTGAWPAAAEETHLFYDQVDVSFAGEFGARLKPIIALVLLMAPGMAIYLLGGALVGARDRKG